MSDSFSVDQMQQNFIVLFGWGKVTTAKLNSKNA